MFDKPSKALEGLVVSRFERSGVLAKKKSKLQPTELELMILKVLWDSPASELPKAVRDIRDGLAELGRELAHTSVITTLNIMLDKGFLKRTKLKNAFLFAPKVKRDAVQSRVIDDVLNRIFDGSAQSLMLTLMDHADVDSEDLAEIRRMITRKSKQKPE
ncbi:MAG: BlaI/MecI/CopY family transcriptional regulator [Mariniblastus sp.]